MIIKADFTISARALYNTFLSELFGLAQAITHVPLALAFVACVFVVTSSLLKIVECTLFGRHRMLS